VLIDATLRGDMGDVKPDAGLILLLRELLAKFVRRRRPTTPFIPSVVMVIPGEALSALPIIPLSPEDSSTTFVTRTKHIFRRTLIGHS